MTAPACSGIGNFKGTIMKNRLSHRVFVVAALALGSAAVFAGCKHKDRLTSNYFNFTITPPAAQLLKGQAITLTASTGGSADIQPNWEVTPITAGAFSPAVGRAVVFTPAILGDATVFATYDGVQARSQIAVVAYISTATVPNRFDVYTDNGLPTTFGGASFGPDIFVGGTMTLSEPNTGYTTEGLKYLHGTGFTGGFWGVALDTHLTGAKANLASFSFGNLKFSIRLARTLTISEDIRIAIDDTIGLPGNDGGVVLSSIGSFSKLSTDWQDISIPVATFSPTQDLSQIKVPFAIALQNMGSSLTFDVDAVRWEK